MWLQDLVEHALLDLLFLRIVRERGNADGGEESTDLTANKLLETLKKCAGVRQKKDPTGREFCRDVGNAVRMDAGLCVGESLVLVRPGLINSLRWNGLNDTVIRRRRWEARYARLVVKAVLGRVIPQDLQARVLQERDQEEVSFRHAIDNPEILFDILD